MKLSVVGLGKLGACSAACFAYRGFNVLGIDINRSYVDAINEQKAPVEEPRLQELISASCGRLTATDDFEQIINETDITFIIVPTPSRPDGHFSDKFLLDVLKSLCKPFQNKKNTHHFVIVSTVSPGTTESKLIPFIESHSEKKLNKDFFISYNPEFIALGNVITHFLNPDMVLMGESNTTAGSQLAEYISKNI